MTAKRQAGSDLLLLPLCSWTLLGLCGSLFLALTHQEALGLQPKGHSLASAALNPS